MVESRDGPMVVDSREDPSDLWMKLRKAGDKSNPTSLFIIGASD